MLKAERREAKRRKARVFRKDNRKSVALIDSLSFEPNQPKKKSKRKHGK